MELANCLVSLGGDKNNQVPKFGVTPAEIMVLQAIHGDDAVTEVEPLSDTVERSNAEEIERLVAHYPAKDEDGQLVIRSVYPGGRPMLHQTIADLNLPEAAFLVTARVKPTPAKPAKKAKAEKAESIPVETTVDDVFDMDDADETAPAEE